MRQSTRGLPNPDGQKGSCQEDQTSSPRLFISGPSSGQYQLRNTTGSISGIPLNDYDSSGHRDKQLLEGDTTARNLPHR